MSRERPPTPLLLWLTSNGFGDAARLVVSLEDYDRFAASLPSKPTGESMRQIAAGYRRPGWELAFEIEALTAISAHDLRDPKWYREAA